MYDNEQYTRGEEMYEIWRDEENNLLGTKKGYYRRGDKNGR